MQNFKKNISELELVAALWWPEKLKKLESESSIIPTLVDSQDKFLSILKLMNEKQENIFNVLEASKFPANLFLKHLIVLSDFGGEPLQRLNKNFSELFSKNKKGEFYFEYYWGEKKHVYSFSELPIRGNLSNPRLKIDGKSLNTEFEMSALYKDVAMILLFGASAVDDHLSAVLNKCIIGTLLGNDDALEDFVRQRYIFVSRITGGAKANTLGQVTQTYAVDYLKDALGKEYKVVRNGHITVANGKDALNVPFDIVVEKDKAKYGIEVSFQVTTNSTIERKAGQAESRQKLLHGSGYKLAYIIDGAGNFQRKSAISTICQFSDCTVAFTDDELNILIDFIKQN